jgi:hypothetical protein
MRSALKDAPVTSFTTLLIRATQHATGLMVEVALLLPSRGLPSSHRQLCWTHTQVLLQAWLDVGIFGILSLSASVPADELLFIFLFISCTFSFLIVLRLGSDAASNATPDSNTQRWQKC